jgi:hypothetical protein
MSAQLDINLYGDQGGKKKAWQHGLFGFNLSNRLTRDRNPTTQHSLFEH